MIPYSSKPFSFGRVVHFVNVVHLTITRCHRGVSGGSPEDGVGSPRGHRGVTGGVSDTSEGRHFSVTLTRPVAYIMTGNGDSSISPDSSEESRPVTPYSCDWSCFCGVGLAIWPQSRATGGPILQS
jgi:hypothetical protein